MAPQPSRQLSTVTSAVTEVSNVNDFDDSSVDGEDGGLSSRSTSIQHLLAQSGTCTRGPTQMGYNYFVVKFMLT